MNTRLVNKILLKEDIFGYGKYESCEIDDMYSIDPCDYPNVVILMNIEDEKILYQEALDFIEKNEKNYVRQRMLNLPDGITPAILRDVLTECGFKIGNYQGYGLRIPGTTTLLPNAPLHTKKLIEEFPTLTFRQQYAVAYNTWNTKYHIDHADYTIHGYRCMVPLNGPVHIVFKENKNNVLYKLNPGRAYFVNIAKMHRAFHPYKDPRINLSWQMNSAKLIVNGTQLESITWDNYDNIYKDNNSISEYMYD